MSEDLTAAPETNGQQRAVAPIPSLVRPNLMRVELCVYERPLSGEKQPYHKVIASLRSRWHPGSVPDDVGALIQGRIDPSTVRVDGNRVFAVIELVLKPSHRVEKMFNIADVSAEEIAATEAARDKVIKIHTDHLMEMASMAEHGKTDEEIAEYAVVAGGVDRTIAASLVTAIRSFSAQGPGAAEAAISSVASQAAAEEAAITRTPPVSAG